MLSDAISVLVAAVAPEPRPNGPCTSPPNDSCMDAPLDALKSFFSAVADASAESASASAVEALWAALRAQSPTPAAHLALLLVDRVRLGCIASARAYLRWIAVPGAGAFNVFHPTIFGATLDALSPQHHAALVDASGAALTGAARDAALAGALGDLAHALRSDAAAVHMAEADLAAAAHAVGSNAAVACASSSSADASGAAKAAPKRRRRQRAKAAPSKPRGRPQRKRRAAERVSYAEDGGDEEYDDEYDAEADAEVDAEADAEVATLPLREQIVATAATLLSVDHVNATSTALVFLLRLMPTILMTARIAKRSSGVQTTKKQSHSSTGLSSHAIAKRARESAIAIVAELIESGSASAELHDAALSMLRRVCIQVPNRSEGRNLAMGAVTTLLFKLPTPLVRAFVPFIATLSRSAKTVQRIAAILLIERVVNAALSGVAEDLWVAPTTTDGAATCAPLLLAALWDRVRDKAPNVRCAALRSLGNMLKKMPSPHQAQEVGAGDAAAAASSVGHRVVAAALGIETWTLVDSGASFEGTSIAKPRALGRALVARLADAKSTVRRGALSAFLAALTCIGDDAGSLVRLLRMFAVNAAEPSTTPAAARCLMIVMRKVAQLCSDATLSVRKLAVQALTSTLSVWCGGTDATGVHAALASAVAAQLRALWVKQGLPLLGDGETSVRHTCAISVATLLVAPIANSATNAEVDAANAWELLGTIAMDASTKQSISAAMRLLYSGKITGCDVPDVESLLSVLMATVRRSIDAGAAGDAKLERLERGAWAILLELVGCSATEDLALTPELVKFLLAVWTHIDRSSSEGNQGSSSAPCGWRSISVLRARHVLAMLSDVAPYVPADAAAALTSRLLARLRTFASSSNGMHANAVRPAINALIELTAARSASAVAVAKACEKWMTVLMRGAMEQLKKISLSTARVNEKQALICLYTVGELCMAAMGDPTLDDAPAMLEEEEIGSEGGHAPRRREGAAALPKSVHKALFGRSVVAIVQALTARTCVPDSAVTTPVSVRAHAFLTLGKLCLHDAALAQSCVAVLVRELAPSTEESVEGDIDAVVRSNVLVVLGDLCKQHTGIVERYVPDIARCLQDRSHIVRENALLVISSLLLEGFIRLRGPVFFRMLAAFAIESHPAPNATGSAAAHVRMANNLRHTIFEIFARRDHALLPAHFVETMFVFNDCADHPAYRRWIEEGMSIASVGEDGAAAGVGGKESTDAVGYSSEASRAAAEDAKQMFSLAGFGELAMARRRTVYAAMLASMGAEGKLRVTARIGREVLAAALEGSVHIDSELVGTGSPSSQLLLDAFDVLCCEDIKVKVRTSSAGADYDADAASQLQEDAGSKPMQAAVAAARTRLLSRMNRKAVLEHVVPVLIALKQKLEASHSPLVGSLMRYLKQLFLEKETRAEVLDVLADDRTLANEIMYDLRMFDEQQQVEGGADGAAVPPGSSSSSSSSGSSSAPASAAAAPAAAAPRTARLVLTPRPTPLMGSSSSGATGGATGGAAKRTTTRRGRSRRVDPTAGGSPMVPLSLEKRAPPALPAAAMENARSANVASTAAAAGGKNTRRRSTRSTRAR